MITWQETILKAHLFGILRSSRIFRIFTGGDRGINAIVLRVVCFVNESSNTINVNDEVGMIVSLFLNL